MTDNVANTTADVKRSYETPTLNVVGSFEAVTQHAGTGWALDAGFQAGTTIGSLTFSDPPR